MCKLCSFVPPLYSHKGNQLARSKTTMSKKIKGRIYLVPTPLSDDNLENLSPEIKSIVSRCTHFLVESFKMGRRHIKSMNPLVQFDVKPTDKVAVIGIGGLGHLALQFLKEKEETVKDIG